VKDKTGIAQLYHIHQDANVKKFINNHNVVDAFVGLKYQQRPRIRKEQGERNQN
jgi:hypothetical protein